jgi:transposase
MQSISTIGLDIAKSVFQVHGVDAAGQVVLRRQLKRPARSNAIGTCRSRGGDHPGHAGVT